MDRLTKKWEALDKLASDELALELLRSQDYEEWRAHELRGEKVLESGLRVLRVVGAKPEFVPPPGGHKEELYNYPLRDP